MATSWKLEASEIRIVCMLNKGKESDLPALYFIVCRELVILTLPFLPGVSFACRAGFGDWMRGSSDDRDAPIH